MYIPDAPKKAPVAIDRASVRSTPPTHSADAKYGLPEETAAAIW
jgi:hypothetical protein